MKTVSIPLNTNSLEDYRRFLAIRRSPVYHFAGSVAKVPREYAAAIDGTARKVRNNGTYQPSAFLFDYQAAIAGLAIRKRKFATFVECGLGKTLILLEFAKHCQSVIGRKNVLIVSPLMVVPQTIAEAERFYPGIGIQQVSAANLQEWLNNGTGIGITNYEAIKAGLTAGRLGSLILDESSMLKSHYGHFGTRLLRLGAGLEWKLCLTGTPAPNDRIEYANHAVFLGACRTVNEFLARYFVNRGQTQERWEMKPHALAAFYRDLSHWCIFVTNPGAYGWKDNAGTIPPIHVHIHRVEMSRDQVKAVQQVTGGLMAGDIGGIGQRSKLGQIAKGFYNGKAIESAKPEFIRSLIETWPDESSLVWCLYNEEQKANLRMMPDAADITGDTPLDKRVNLINEFKAGKRKVLQSKPKILGFGLNLQVATRQVFSGLQDSYESYWQAVKRSNRVGSDKPLNVHIPITDVEEPMVQNVLRKAAMVEADTAEQQRMFLENAWNAF